MASYPSINWWPCNLRPYESVMSFATRFCSFNGITLRQYEEFFGYEIGNERSLSGADISRIASMLNEEVSLVQTVLAPSITFANCGFSNLSRADSYSDAVRYCEKCAALGYHSYLHEAHWLAKCPLHHIDLKSYPSPNRSGPVFKRRIAAFKKLMKSSCKEWPRNVQEGQEIDIEEKLALVSNWMKRAVSASNRMAQGQFWYSVHGIGNSDLSCEQALGQLRTLEPMAKDIEPLFAPGSENWQVEIRRFSFQVKTELQRVKEYISFELLFDFYKKISAYSMPPPPFITKLRAGQDAIRERHAKCHCAWGRLDAGWHTHWVKADPDGWPHWGCVCPYTVALEELEQNWGRMDIALSKRKLEEERERIIRRSHEAFDAGLIGYAANANVSPKGYLYEYPQVWPCCEWLHQSALSELLNLAAELEIEAAMMGITSWLDNINAGACPDTRDDPPYCIRICETEEGVSLLKWTCQSDS